MKAAPVILAASIVCGSASASDGPPLGFPELDVERSCSAAFKSANTYNVCIEEEERGYRRLWRVWPYMSDEARVYCTNHIGSKYVGGGTYNAIADCAYFERQRENATNPNLQRKRFAP